MNYPNRKLHRLQTWDYSAPGYYFVTICTGNKRCLLSRITGSDDGAEVQLTNVGRIVRKCWERMNSVAPHIRTDHFCIMPNHIHGIVVIEAHSKADARSLSDLIHGFKSAVTREYNRMADPGEKNQLWQSSYYDEIIRNEEMLLRARKYIEDNPAKWVEDELFTI